MHSMTVVGWSALWMSCGLILIAAVDVPFQLWSSKQKLMMTKQEVRDEYKDSEGKPEVKQRIRQFATGNGRAAHDAVGARRRRGDHQPNALCRGLEVRSGQGQCADVAGQGWRLHRIEDSRNRQ